MTAMKKLGTIQLEPSPGTRQVRFRGDTITFTLSLPESRPGSAYLRTNIGHADIARSEIIRNVVAQETPLGRDWFDIPMRRTDATHFTATLPLCQVGHFEAKGYFVSDDDLDLYWPQGANVVINVQPADTCCANIIYNAFVRQFGPNKSGGFFEGLEPAHIRTLDQTGFTVIPPSGTFRSLVAALDFIVLELGCRYLQLLPVHPTPSTYARMGRYGSPYAALSFTAVDPALAEFDPGATPLEQFIELVDAVHARSARVILDIAINHTGWAASLHGTHPEWLVRNEQGQIENPGAWGVRWEDLTKLDYRHKDLWQYMTEVFLTWCRRGVDGFRCDAGYMIPTAAWRFIIARVRQHYPDTIFFLEGLGGKIAVTRELLNSANFNWAYSELFQNYDRDQIGHYLPEPIDISDHDGIMVHFAETHDNPRLAARSPVYARMRTALCALFSPNGAFAFANGVEWFATEKINVHESPSLNWGAAVNQVADIQRLTTLLKSHPAFFDQTTLRMLPRQADNCVGLIRHHVPSGKRLLVAANLDDRKPGRVSWTVAHEGFRGHRAWDLLTQAEIELLPDNGGNTVALGPGQVVCLTAEPTDLAAVSRPQPGTLPERIVRQRLRAKALDVYVRYHAALDLNDFDPDQAADRLADDAIGFCQSQNPSGPDPRVILWRWPEDTRREVMVPPDHFLLVLADMPFRVRIEKNRQAQACEESLPTTGGLHFALFTPLPPPAAHTAFDLILSVFAPDGCRHDQAPMLFLSRPDAFRLKRTLGRLELLTGDRCLLQTNPAGSALKCPLVWGHLASRYDALLAANLHPDVPAERWIMFTRCRIWAVYQDFSQEIGNDCIDRFTRDDQGRGIWCFRVPTGQGCHVNLTIRLELLQNANTVLMTLHRSAADQRNGDLADDLPVQLILRPDIENRSFHETTKAYQGPENAWPAAVAKEKDGFTFRPDKTHHLRVRVEHADFVWQPEWQYMVHRLREKERGQDPDSDLFSPGYFSVFIGGNQSVILTADMEKRDVRRPGAAGAPAHADPAAVPALFPDLEPAPELIRSVQQFIANRGEYRTVIAGYPWFLDWGRDSLIFTRGLIAAGLRQQARDIIRLFGRFEADGTLPNMILGETPANRDTSDAPLWFVVACADLLQDKRQADFLEAPCGNRTVRQVVSAIGKAMLAGTPNGIYMDKTSGLLFSPSHFTWMDTNHPAGTPREGYPIEIQGLWFAALSFLARIDSTVDWQQLADRVRTSIQHLFYDPRRGFLSDCLHAPSGINARQAEADDALRPNQLLAIALDAVTEPSIARASLKACQTLLVPGAIRSLADRPLERPLNIVHNGQLLSDPYRPYRGSYQGDEDTRRKPAYHNGTAWTWMFPVFCEAWVKGFGPGSKDTALSWLSSTSRLLEEGCAGQLPEIVDGDYPHTQRGCDAQAWGMSELVRVWLRLSK